MQTVFPRASRVRARPRVEEIPHAFLIAEVGAVRPREVRTRPPAAALVVPRHVPRVPAGVAGLEATVEALDPAPLRPPRHRIPPPRRHAITGKRRRPRRDSALLRVLEPLGLLPRHNLVVMSRSRAPRSSLPRLSDRHGGRSHLRSHLRLLWLGCGVQRGAGRGGREGGVCAREVEVHMLRGVLLDIAALDELRGAGVGVGDRVVLEHRAGGVVDEHAVSDLMRHQPLRVRFHYLIVDSLVAPQRFSREQVFDQLLDPQRSVRRLSDERTARGGWVHVSDRQEIVRHLDSQVLEVEGARAPRVRFGEREELLVH
mmetsp:Transcript_11728/g.28445  ORF Transcript_11728/g.28445 Transcript_11728/m.28445 type:complete len:314 (-) Transcript_11728:431-1372(-)